MISVIIECKDRERELAVTLSALVPGAVEGLVAEVIVIDRGSRDGTARLADAAGCRFLSEPDLEDVVRNARGDWLLLLEPGARPISGWIDHMIEYLGTATMAARFSPSREYRLPFFSRIFRRPSALEYGLLLPKRQAVANLPGKTHLEELARGLAVKRLKCEIAPASVLDLD